jgi:hypothetical protein
MNDSKKLFNIITESLINNPNSWEYKNKGYKHNATLDVTHKHNHTELVLDKNPHRNNNNCTIDSETLFSSEENATLYNICMKNIEDARKVFMGKENRRKLEHKKEVLDTLLKTWTNWTTKK